MSPLIKVKEKELSTDIVEGADAIEVLSHLESPETVTEKGYFQSFFHPRKQCFGSGSISHGSGSF